MAAFELIQRVLGECRDDGISVELVERMLFRYWLRTSTINHDTIEAYFQRLDSAWAEVTAAVDLYIEKYAEPLRVMR